MDFLTFLILINLSSQFEDILATTSFVTLRIHAKLNLINISLTSFNQVTIIMRTLNLSLK